MEIVTVKNSKITLEKFKANQVIINVNDNSVIVQGSNVIVRADGVEVPTNQMASLSIHATNTTMGAVAGLTDQQLATIQDARQAFIDQVKTVLESVAKTV